MGMIGATLGVTLRLQVSSVVGHNLTDTLGKNLMLGWIIGAKCFLPS
jgi:hypothetical protein